MKGDVGFKGELVNTKVVRGPEFRTRPLLWRIKQRLRDFRINLRRI